MRTPCGTKTDVARLVIARSDADDDARHRCGSDRTCLRQHSDAAISGFGAHSILGVDAMCICTRVCTHTMQNESLCSGLSLRGGALQTARVGFPRHRTASDRAGSHVTALGRTWSAQSRVFVEMLLLVEVRLRGSQTIRRRPVMVPTGLLAMTRYERAGFRSRMYCAGFVRFPSLGGTSYGFA